MISRCQLVRFDPLPAARLARAAAGGGGGARARARPARGWRWATATARGGSPRRRARRCCADVDHVLVAALAGRSDPTRGRGCWSARSERGKEAASRVAAERKARLEGEPKGRDRSAIERQFEDDRQARGAPRAQREVLDLGLDPCGAGPPRPDLPGGGRARGRRWIPRARRGSPKRPAAATPAACARPPSAARTVRLSLELNVTEDLALSALGYRLAGAGRHVGVGRRELERGLRPSLPRDPARPQAAPLADHLAVLVEEQHVDAKAHAEGVHRGAAEDEQGGGVRDLAEPRKSQQPRPAGARHVHRRPAGLAEPWQPPESPRYHAL